MITIRLVGGLGNQMFQYAAALALAKRHGTGVLLDPTAQEFDANRPYQLSAFRVDSGFAEVRLRPGRFTIPLRSIARPGREYVEPAFSYDPAFFNVPDDCALNGFFQSWRYGQPVEAELRGRFALQSPLSSEGTSISAQVAAAPLSVSIHVRRGDYLHPASAPMFNSIGLDYYRRAIEVLNGLLDEEPHFFLFSDDPDWVRQNLAGLGHCTVVEGQADSPWEDLTLMAQCRHHIIANSSFSWWGAWLNPRPDKWVIAPRQWFTPDTLRRKNICDLLPPEWIAV